MPEIEGVMVPFMPIGGLQELKKKSGISAIADENKTSFNEIFKEELNKLKFSAHAQSRMTSREINLTGDDLQRLSHAVDKAQQKGSSETLVMLDEKAFIINIPNKTVITVVDKNKMESNVITDIDSAVMA
jgi:flagellar operon protein